MSASEERSEPLRFLQKHVTLVIVFILLASGLGYSIYSEIRMQELNSKIQNLESELAFLDDRGKDQFDLLQDDISYLRDDAESEVGNLATCVNAFIEAWASRTSAYYCLPPWGL
jgi:hypothetical protein